MPLPAVTATAAVPRLDLRSIICDAFEGKNRLGGGAFPPLTSGDHAYELVTDALQRYADRPLSHAERSIVSVEVAMEWNRRRARLTDPQFDECVNCGASRAAVEHGGIVYCLEGHAHAFAQVEVGQ